MKCMLVGSSGRLGTELQKLRQFTWTPSSQELDVTDIDSVGAYVLDKRIDLIINCAAYTNVAQAEIDRLNCYRVNVTGAENLSDFDIRLLFISSEYAADPTNYYSYTKEAAEDYADKSLRFLFKPRPWPYEYAFEDQFTSGDYIDVIAAEVNRAIDLYDYLPKVTNIGTGRKSMYDLAKQTKPDVKPNSVKDYIKETGIKIPLDSSMDCSEWQRIKEQHAKHTSIEANSG